MAGMLFRRIQFNSLILLSPLWLQLHKTHAFPPGPGNVYYPPPHPTQVDAWRNYAVSQYTNQSATGSGLNFGGNASQYQPGFGGFPSIGELKEAVRAGMGYGLSLTGGGPGNGTQPSLWDGLDQEADGFLV